MFCMKCGQKVPDNAKFCSRCGAEIKAIATGIAEDEPEEKETGIAVDTPAEKAEQAPTETSSTTPDPQAAPQVAAPATPQPAPKKSNRGKIIAAVVAVIIICAGIGIGVWWKFDQDQKAKQAEWDRAHVTLITRVTGADTPGFDDAATAIPVQVKGTDLDGNEVDEVQFMRPAAMQVETKQGSYDLVFPGGYFTSDGQAVKAPGTTVHVDVALAEQAAGGQQGTAPAPEKAEAPTTIDEPLTYAPIDPLEVTDEQINDIAQWTAQDPDDNGKADQLKAAATTKRDEAIAEKKRQEEEAAERARVEARKAEITQTAEEYLYTIYDNNGERGRQITKSRPSTTMWGFVNGTKSLQSGWPNTKMVSLNDVHAIDENTVAYDLDYSSSMGNPPKWSDKHDSGTISFGDNGLIDQWYPEGSPNGRLV